MEKKWWHESIGYQIYPKSFMDSNGDGIGDLRGIIEKLDYLEYLGINLIWICPIFKSPQVDHGYDISDYEDIDPMYGTKEELKELIEKAKQKGIRIILDLVVNHTSEEHAWFKEALVNKDSKYRDYYVFKKGVKNIPPNNWAGLFNVSTWEKIDTDNDGNDEYYLHIFTKEQPDLNWENPALRREVYDVVNRWLDFGIAGFRVDAISHIKKNYDYTNKKTDRSDGLYFALEHFNNCDGIVDLLQELKRETFAKYDCFTVGEVNQPTTKDLADYVGENGHFSSVFEFSHVYSNINKEENREDIVSFWNKLKNILFKVQLAVDEHTFITNILENHDLCRAIDRFIPKKYQNFYSASMLATTNFFMKGIVFIYQGQEIGMTNFPKKDIHEYKDPTTIRRYEKELELGKTPAEALANVNISSREHSRTPIQWNNEKNAGFTTGQPWFEVNPNYSEINVEIQLKDKDSLLNYYKRLVVLRKKYNDVFVHGKFETLFVDNKSILAYKRDDIVVVNNYSNDEVVLDLDINEVLLSNYDDVIYSKNTATLKPFQSIIAK